MFHRAEQLHLTVAKLITGRDMPLSNVEWELQNTYAMARQKFDKQRGKGKGRRR